MSTKIKTWQERYQSDGWRSARHSCMDDEISALRARVAELEATQDVLLPMETAPKDGSEVLLRVKHRAGIPGKFLVGHYVPGGHCIEDHPPVASGWYFWNGCMFDRAAEPINWIPLPDTNKGQKQ